MTSESQAQKHERIRGQTETLTRLSISGFKSIRELNDFEMCPFNVFIGANGSGKSNFIDFFRMLNHAFKSAEGHLQHYIAESGNASSLLHYGAKQFRHIDSALKFDGNNQWSQYSFSLAWGAPDELFYASELLEYQRDGKDFQPRKTQLGSGHRETAVLKAAKEDSLVKKTASVFLMRLRGIQVYHFHDTSSSAYVRLTQDIDRNQYLAHHAGNLAAFLYGLKINKFHHYQRILATLQLVLPFIRDFVLEPEVFNQRSILLRWMDQSGETFGPHQLSDGAIRLISLVTALLQPEETLPSIMIVDEPELGLHPAAVRLVASLLKAVSLKRQVIVATQSPLLIRAYDPEDIVVVERQAYAAGREESIFSRLESKPLKRWLKNFDLGELYEKNVTGGAPQ